MGSTAFPFNYLSLHFWHLYGQPGKRTVQKDMREMVLMGVGIRKGEQGKQARRKIPAMAVKRVRETQEASQAVGTLPFSASLTRQLSCSNISSWQLVRDTSEIFDYKQRWVISLVLGFVKSTCYITKPKCWVYLDSTPVASAVLGELLWPQMLSR